MSPPEPVDLQDGNHPDEASKGEWSTKLIAWRVVGDTTKHATFFRTLP